MKVNIYAEEITNKVSFQRKVANGTTFYGVTFHLESSPVLHHSEGDDDSSSVTFWFKDNPTAELLMDNFVAAYQRVAFTYPGQFRE